MKKRNSKKSFSVRSRFWQIVIVVTILVSSTASQSSAIELGKVVGDIRQGANTVITQIRNNPNISSIFQKTNEITTLFFPEIQKIANISTEDLRKIQGLLGQLSPNEAKQAVDNKKSNPGAAPSNLHQGKAALTASELAANQELSLEAQQLRKKNIEEVSEISDNSITEATASQTSAQQSESAYSSQDVLKLLAKQSGNQSAILAAQVRLIAHQNNNMQDIKTQLAVANQANASFERRQEGEVQKKIIDQQETSTAIIQNKIRSYLQEGY